MAQLHREGVESFVIIVHMQKVAKCFHGRGMPCSQGEKPKKNSQKGNGLSDTRHRREQLPISLRTQQCPLPMAQTQHPLHPSTQLPREPSSGIPTKLSFGRPHACFRELDDTGVWRSPSLPLEEEPEEPSSDSAGDGLRTGGWGRPLLTASGTGPVASRSEKHACVAGSAPMP